LLWQKKICQETILIWALQGSLVAGYDFQSGWPAGLRTGEIRVDLFLLFS